MSLAETSKLDDLLGNGTALADDVNSIEPQRDSTAEKLPTVIEFTEITALRPACVTKEFNYADGQLQKKTTANVFEGYMRRVKVQDAQGFADALVDLTTDRCFMYGHPPRDARLVTLDAWIRLGRPEDVLPRTKECTSWPKGGGVLLLDYDAPRDGSPPLDRQQLISLIAKVCPALLECSFVWWPSTSSHIWAGEVQLQGLRGQRIYLFVADATDIPRVGKILNELLWADGHGRYEVSASGSLLERPVFDGSVWQPNRIDFAAGAKCAAGLEQRRGVPMVITGRRNELLDTRRTISELTPDQIESANSHKEAAKAALRSLAEQARSKWVEERTDMLIAAKPGLDRDLVRQQVIRAAERRNLMGDWVLHVRDPNRVEHQATVLEVLDNPSKYHGMQTLDPLEPDYDGRRWVGKLYLYGARPNLYSMAHGGVVYSLTRQPQRIEVIKGKGSETTDACLEVLRRAPDLFDFGGQPVAIEPGGRIHPLDEHALRYETGKITQFWCWKMLPKGRVVEELLDPPPNVIRNVLSLGARRGLKKLNAVVTAPTLRLDGSVLDVPGYDPSTQLLYECDGIPVVVTIHPTREEAENALKFLWHPFDEFPFVASLDRAVHLAALITASLRSILPTSPAFGYDAPVQASGKTLLARCVGVLAEGEDASVWPHTAGQDDEEIRKRLLTILRTGRRCIVWDNVVGVFDSAALASFLTSSTFTDRILGASLATTVPNRTIFVMTGNNLMLAGDLPRRVLVCRIDPRTDKPFAREFLLDPFAHCRAHRQSLIAAALTLVRAMLTHGCQRTGAGCLASYEDWDRLVRQTVLYANELLPGYFGDVMDAVNAAHKSDPEMELLQFLLRGLVMEFGLGRDMTTSEILGRSKSLVSGHPLFEAIEELSPVRRNTVSLGRLLSSRVGRVCSGMRLEDRGKDRNGVRLWRVCSVPNPSNLTQRADLQMQGERGMRG